LPFATYYHTSALSYLVSKRLITVPSVTMMNLLIGQPVIDEFIQHDATPQRMADAVLHLLDNKAQRERILDACRTVRTMLGGAGASARAAAIIAQRVGR
jgi:lipid-A-disaccharide synthase